MKDDNETIEAYITKYALTTGIFKVTGEVSRCTPRIITVQREGTFDMYYHDEDWHRTLDGAIKRAEEMREKKMVSLKKNIKKLESLDFSNTREAE